MKPVPPVDARLVPAALVAWLLAFGGVLVPAATVAVRGTLVAVACVWPAVRTVRELRRASPRARDPTGPRVSAHPRGRTGRLSGMWRRGGGDLPGRSGRLRGTSQQGGTDEGNVPSGRHRAAVHAPVAAAVLVAGAVAAATLLAVAGHVHVRTSGTLAVLTERSASVALTGRVAADPAPLAPAHAWDTEPRYRVRLDVGAVERRGVVGAARAPVLVLGPQEWASVTLGATVQARGRLVPTDPGDDVVALLVAGGPEVVRPPPGYQRVAGAMRAGLVDAVAGASPQARGLVPGIAVGDDSALPPELDAAMTAVSLTHVTAVSGAHVAIILGTVLALLVWVPRWARAVLGGLVLVGFVVLVRPEASVLRAATMGAVALVALLLGRPARALPGLCAAVVVLLLVDPWMARSYGFVLSVLATGGLVLLAGPWAQALSTRLPGWLAHTIAVPAAAQVCCAPVIILLSPGIATYAVPANVLAAPAVPPATVLGVLATLCAPWWPDAAGALAGAAGWFTAWIALMATFWAGLPGAQVPWLGGAPGAVALVVVTIVAIILARRLTWRPAQMVVLVVVALLVVVPGPRRAVTAWWPGAWPPQGWLAVQCDVGQGSAFVVRSGPGAAVMVDVGPLDGGADACLRGLGVTHLDLLVLTHLHADHVGDLAAVMEGRTVERALLSPHGEPRAAAAAVLDDLADAGVEVLRPAAGDAGTDGAEPVRWKVLWPTARAVSAAPAGDGDAVNDLSLVVRLETPGLSVVALGDIEPGGQRGLLRELRLADAAGGPGPPDDVVLVPHHGSPRQDAALAEHLAGRLALVSVGTGNDYGHPAPTTLAMYRAGGALVLRTDECGAVAVVRTRGGLGAVSGCRPRTGRLRLSVGRGRLDPCHRGPADRAQRPQG
ncbi:ComEC/Rec2 family competence protein [Georgenia sp. MJ206]|uniref:ComEC/Rec2 family competence protein n=1 Tax=Georgenia wangjunii TaxID=3117730 RepID=UPI002F266048